MISLYTRVYLFVNQISTQQNNIIQFISQMEDIEFNVLKKKSLILT